MLTSEENKKWYALYVASRQEKKVFELLLAKNIEAFVPLIKTIRQCRAQQVDFEQIVPRQLRRVEGGVAHCCCHQA